MRFKSTVFPRDYARLQALPLEERLASMYRRVSAKRKDDGDLDLATGRPEPNRKLMPRPVLDGQGVEVEMIVDGIGRPVYPIQAAIQDQNGYPVFLRQALPAPEPQPVPIPETEAGAKAAFWDRSMV